MNTYYQTIITSEELVQNLDQPNMRIIDTRSFLDDFERGNREFLVSHLPGAIHADLEKNLSSAVIPGKTGRHPLPDPSVLVDQFSAWGIGPDTQVVVYDQSHGGIAARLWWLLNWMMHQNCAVLEGGWQKWTELKLPTSQIKTTPRPEKFAGSPQSEWLVSATRLEKHLDDDLWKIVDSRAENRYHGIEEPIDPVAGHIPSAINRPFLHNLDANLNWKDKFALAEEWQDILAEKKIDDTVIYCGSGVTACHNILALRLAGYDWPKIYAGSWSEWITDESRPVQS